MDLLRVASMEGQAHWCQAMKLEVGFGIFLFTKTRNKNRQVDWIQLPNTITRAQGAFLV